MRFAGKPPSSACWRMSASLGDAVNAVDFVASDIALNPLDLKSEFGENAAGSLRDVAELIARHFTCSGDFPLDHNFGMERLLRNDGLGTRKTEEMVPWRGLRVNGGSLY